MTVYGGAETVVAKLSACLTKKGFENAVLTLSLSSEIANMCKDVKFLTPKKNCVFKSRSTNLLDAVGVISEIKILNRLVRMYASSFDVINIHNFPATWSLVFNNYKPVVWMCNEPPDLWNNPHPSVPLKVLRNAGVVCDRFIVNKYMDSICVADEINAERAFKRYKRQSEIIHYGIDYELFCHGEGSRALEKYGLYNEFLLLQTGMITPQKNQLESIKAVEKLIDHIPNIKLILAGMGGSDYEKIVREYICKKGLKEYIVFTGHISKLDVCNLYHACNAALFPVKSQGGWLAPFEALCAAKPVIVSSSMGAASVIKRENIGIVTDNFADSIKNIYDNPSANQLIADRGKQWVAKNLTWEIFTDKMLQLFDKAFRERKK